MADGARSLAIAQLKVKAPLAVTRDHGRTTDLPRTYGRISRDARDKLAAAYAADPTLAGCMAVQPSGTAPAAFLLDINEWLRRYHVRLM